MSERIPRLIFSRNWEDPADFSTKQSSEVQNRKDLQSLYTEIQTYLNHVLLPVLENGDWGGGEGGGSGGGDLSAYLPLSGGTMRGVLRLFRNPRFNDEAATKQYVDSASETVRTDLAGNISAILQRAESIELLVQGNTGEIAALKIRVGGIETRVEDNEHNISTVTQTAREIDARVSDLDEDVNSRIRQLADSISLEVSAPFAEGDRTYSRITLKIGPNNVYGDILLDGNVDISGQLSAEALYAACGEVADLEVDRLSTSRRIVKYLAGDAGDDNHIRIREQVLEFVAGHCLGGTTQARTPGGDLLYWPMDVAGLSRGEDGYPRTRIGERVFTTTRETDFPVLVYTYAEEVKRSIRFLPGESGAYEPVDVFGAGNAAGYNQGFLKKSTEGMSLRYVTPTGKEIGVRMDAGGYMDLAGLRRTVSLNFSRWDSGTFSEQVEGTGTTMGYSVSFDAQSRPTSITDGTGHALSITW